MIVINVSANQIVQNKVTCKLWGGLQEKVTCICGKLDFFSINSTKIKKTQTDKISLRQTSQEQFLCINIKKIPSFITKYIMSRSNYDKYEHLRRLKNRGEPPQYLRYLLNYDNIENRWQRGGSDELLPEISQYLNTRYVY